jgi:uncharacterized damage-inducible protein DinB
MDTSLSLLHEILTKWFGIRRGLIRELNVIPPSRLGFRPTLEMRSVAEIVQHVLEYTIITVEELSREDTNLHRLRMGQLVSVYAPNVSRNDTHEKLGNLLVEQFRDADARLREHGDLHMLQFVTRLDGTRDTRFSFLQEAIQHEMYHRGQLTVYTRLLGFIPAATVDNPPDFGGAIGGGVL